jgi:hypothetical protein
MTSGADVDEQQRIEFYGELARFCGMAAWSDEVLSRLS